MFGVGEGAGRKPEDREEEGVDREGFEEARDVGHAGHFPAVQEEENRIEERGSGEGTEGRRGAFLPSP